MYISNFYKYKKGYNFDGMYKKINFTKEIFKHPKKIIFLIIPS